MKAEEKGKRRNVVLWEDWDETALFVSEDIERIYKEMPDLRHVEEMCFVLNKTIDFMNEEFPKMLDKLGYQNINVRIHFGTEFETIYYRGQKKHMYFVVMLEIEGEHFKEGIVELSNINKFVCDLPIGIKKDFNEEQIKKAFKNIEKIIIEMLRISKEK